MDDSTAQKLYERMVELEERSRALDEHLRTIQEQLQVLAESRRAITELQALPGPTETWIPIAPGAFVKGTVHPASTVLLSVGASVAVEKKPEDVMATLQGHEDTLSDVADQALTELKSIFTEMDAIKARVETNPNESAPHTHHHNHSHGHHH